MTLYNYTKLPFKCTEAIRINILVITNDDDINVPLQIIL